MPTPPNHGPDGGTIAAWAGVALTVTAGMWKGMKLLWRRALRQAQQATLDDLNSVRHMTDQVTSRLDDHAASDATHFAQITLGQNELLAGMDRIDSRLAEMSEKQAVTANDVKWLMREQKKP